MNKALLDKVLALPEDERHDLCERIELSLPPIDDDAVLKAQVEEAARRYQEHLKDPRSAVPIEDVQAWLRSRRA